MSEDIEKRVDIEIGKRSRERRHKDSDLLETVEEVFDKPTILAIIELKNRGCLAELKGVVAAGKEARIYWAKNRNGGDLAVKIYLTSSAEFRKSIWKYIKGDPRYEWITSLPSHKLMSVWAKKEFSNLRKMYEAGVSVPKPFCVYRNVLVMEFIGSEGVRAPLLKEVVEMGKIDYEMAQKIFGIIIKNIYKMYWFAGLVHGDLSEYNVMIHNDNVYIIDVSQAVSLSHPNAHVFLYRDVMNIVKFFRDEIGLEQYSADKLFDYIVSKKVNELEKMLEE
ncbi:serine protein kinase RIO [Ignisphaera sp. 4213-co]|uniref:non-specific serine/threonine protein kinase n=1 Tax=Ignisphaera cupida TaxID=3050454 RepID=A0ABD4Z4V4_9CREN|nr:serine protein kinase RIO [Ignisphaera sp. 4213-co]MDK6028346.1 serine protein kinase RIO [Ignisphaera sp. 4213-co]